MLNCIVVGIGGFLGSILRYLMGQIPIKANSGFPVNTLIINIIGAFVIGVVRTLFSRSSNIDDRLLLMIKVGFCGGFTTFSTFSAESLNLIQVGNWFVSLAYIALSVILCVLAVYCGTLLLKS